MTSAVKSGPCDRVGRRECYGSDPRVERLTWVRQLQGQASKLSTREGG